MRRTGGWLLLTGFVGLAACGGEPTPPPPPPPPAQLTCNNVTATQLAVGEHRVIDPSQSGGCVVVPQAGSGGAEYIVVAASGASTRSAAGVSGSYLLRAGNPGATASPVPPVARVDADAPLRAGPTAAQQFHDMLRAREAAISADPAARRPPAAPPLAVPPVVGQKRTFKVCANLQCSSFIDVAATARFVGSKAVIYMDDVVPQNDTLRDADYQDLGSTFDMYHYPYNLANFGAESDIDGNERIVILMTDGVNALTPDCTNGRVLGYFFGLDLSSGANSNQGEIFYTFVPAPAQGTCTAISRTTAVNNVKPTLIHELQHMISWNQRVIVRGGTSEQIWLNEALSHFAEELGGRQIDPAICMAAGFSSCRSQYISSNIINAYDFLENPEVEFLVWPTEGSMSQGSLAGRGAAWHFLRWVVDQFAIDTILGGDLTRRLVQTVSSGAANVENVTGDTFPRLVTEWLLAAYLDDLDNFAGASPRMRFKSWGLRTIWLDPRNAQIFTSGFPINPDVTGGTYTRTGTLRAGTGRFLRLLQQANGAAIEVQLVGSATGTQIAPALVARIGIARVR